MPPTLSAPSAHLRIRLSPLMPGVDRIGGRRRICIWSTEVTAAYNVTWMEGADWVGGSRSINTASVNLYGLSCILYYLFCVVYSVLFTGYCLFCILSLIAQGPRFWVPLRAVHSAAKIIGFEVSTIDSVESDLGLPQGVGEGIFWFQNPYWVQNFGRLGTR